MCISPTTMWIRQFCWIHLLCWIIWKPLVTPGFKKSKPQLQKSDFERSDLGFEWNCILQPSIKIQPPFQSLHLVVLFYQSNGFLQDFQDKNPSQSIISLILACQSLCQHHIHQTPAVKCIWKQHRLLHLSFSSYWHTNSRFTLIYRNDWRVCI